ncbi:MAG TPA: thermonuclease family protein, partial [Thermomicrobiales bacterium]|nr:thermonuclease family protein [Thermomicrobiales bacterium]
MALRWRATLTFGLTAILLLAELLTIFSNGASAQVNGNSYTGPIHGHTLSWNDSWQVLDEKTDRGEDWILLGDGLSLVGISGVDAYLGNATACARGLLVMLSRDANISNVTPMIGPDGQEVRGGDDSRAFVAYTYTMAVASGPTVDVGRPYASSKIQNSGATVDLAHRRECRTIVPGRSVLVIDHMAPVAAYDVEAPLVEALIAGVTIPSPGETGPAFMTGRLRIAVAGAVEDSAISAVKLSARPGKDWLFLLVDVTNTSSTVAPVTPSDFGLATAGRTKPAHLATGSTTSVAKRLQVEQGDVDAAVQIGPGETRRLVLVFQVPAGAAQPSLRIGSTALPLQAALGRRIDFQHLPASYGPPRLIEAAVDHVIDGDTLSVIPTGQTTPVSVSLIGVDAPVGTECYADKAQTKLRSLAGQNVILESDSTDRQSGRLARYVWTRKDDGSLSMVNRTLLAGGYAGFATSPNDRFGDWLRQGADAARIKPAGLWKACTGLHGT